MRRKVTKGTVATTALIVVVAAFLLTRTLVTECFPGRAKALSALSGSSYFPPGTFPKRNGMEEFIVEWYSEHLIAMEEQALYHDASDEDEKYRLLWLRTFHQPITVTVVNSGTDVTITAKKLSGAGGYEPGTLIDVKTRHFTVDEWAEFTHLLDSSCFWRQKSTQMTSSLDGAQWIIEALKDGHYHLVDRHSPDGYVRQLGLFLLERSGLDLEPVY